MKKIYQIPGIKIVKLHATPILAGSPGYGGETKATSGNLSRQQRESFWGDEE